MIARQLSVRVPAQGLSQYPIFIGNNMLASLRTFSESHKGTRMAFLVDENVYRLHRKKLDSLLRKNEKLYVCPAGEIAKNLETVEKIVTQLLRDGYDRGALIVNVGGGMTTDLGGFLAAIFARGVGFVQIPTTLLAMVDASVGGKTGVDVAHYKNMLGVFSSPTAVFMDMGFLETLPPREYAAGLGECIKHGLISDNSILRDIEQDKYRGKVDFIFKNVQVKARIVQKDFKESGMRTLLNLGHTVGHALESYFLGSKEELLHGEAVALGMLVELAMLERITGLSPQVRERTRKVCQQVGLLNTIKETVNHRDIWSMMQKDKKNKNGEVRISLLRTVGRLDPQQKQWVVPVQRQDFETAYKTLAYGS